MCRARLPVLMLLRLGQFVGHKLAGARGGVTSFEPRGLFHPDVFPGLAGENRKGRFDLRRTGMQRLLTGLVVLALVVSPAMAKADGGRTEAEKNTAAANAAKPEDSAKSDPAAKRESPSMELQL